MSGLRTICGQLQNELDQAWMINEEMLAGYEKLREAIELDMLSDLLTEDNEQIRKVTKGLLTKCLTTVISQTKLNMA